MHLRKLVILLSALASTTACDLGSLGPGPEEDGVLQVRVTGGIAAVDYTYEIASEGDVVGVACGSGCTFSAGDTIQHLTRAQRGAFLDEVGRAGLPTSDRPVDYGTPCCDHFTYQLTYTAGSNVRSVSGGLENFPQPLQRFVRMAHGLYEGTPPVVLRQSTGLQGFDTDPLTLGEIAVEGDLLRIEVEYGGGCREHDVDAVLWTGWMESHPVQVGIAVAHDDFDDPCDAVVHRSLRFDLTPVRRAYTAGYGNGPGTIILRVSQGATGQARLVSYAFN